MGRLSLNDVTTRRIFKVRRTVKFGSQNLRAKTIKQLGELFNIASAIAKGENGKSQRTLKKPDSSSKPNTSM
jgi:hypothetical protein